MPIVLAFRASAGKSAGSLMGVFILSMQFSHSVMSHSLRAYGLQHARLPCLSPIPELTQIHFLWVGIAIQPSHPLLYLFPPAFNLSGIRIFSVSKFFTSGGQSIGVSASTSVFPMNIQDWFPLGLTGWISSQPKGLSRVFSNTTVSINFSALSFLHSPTLTSIHDHWKSHSLD